MAKAGAGAAPEAPQVGRAPTYDELLALVRQQTESNEALRQEVLRLAGEQSHQGSPGGDGPVVLTGLTAAEADARRCAKNGEPYIDAAAFRRDFKNFLSRETMRTTTVQTQNGPIQMMFDAKGNLVSVPEGYNPPPGMTMRPISADPGISDGRSLDAPRSSIAREIVHDRDLSPRQDAVPVKAGADE